MLIQSSFFFVGGHSRRRQKEKKEENKGSVYKLEEFLFAVIICEIAVFDQHNNNGYP